MQSDLPEKMKLVGFDIETASFPISDVEHNELTGWQLGILCAAMVTPDVALTPSSRWNVETGTYTPRMSQQQANAMVEDLLEFVYSGYTICTWNGTGFDFRVLAAESGRVRDCAMLAMDSIDGMLHFFQLHGYAIGLNAAAKGMLNAEKLESGEHAPVLWERGEYGRVLNYVTSDAALTMQVMATVRQQGELKWFTKNGAPKVKRWPRWLTVQEILELDAPTPPHWLKDPWSRDKFTGWVAAATASDEVRYSLR